MTEPKIMVATPIDGLPESAMVPYKHAQALARVLMDRDRLHVMDTGFMGYPADLVRARSRSVRVAREFGATHILWLDNDVVPKAGFLDKMLATGHDMIGCPYPRKRIHWDRVQRAGFGDQAEWHAYDYAYHFNDGPEGRELVKVTDGCIPLTRLSMGCMLTSMRALDAMCDMFRDELWFVDVVDGKHFDCVALFQLMLSERRELNGRPWRTLYSEDYSFCERYNVMRATRPEFGPIQMLVSHPADHVGGHCFRGAAEGLGNAR